MMDDTQLRSPLLAMLLVFLAAFSLSACVTNRTFGEGGDDSAADIGLGARLLTDRSHDFSDVDVTVFEGRVLVTGTVRTEAARLALTDKASRMNLVSEVLNEVVVGGRTSVGQGARDALIDQRLGTAIVADNGIYSGNYKFSGSGGTVYLLGVAQGPDELSRVTGHAQSIDSVSNVVSHVIFVGDPRRK